MTDAVAVLMAGWVHQRRTRPDLKGASPGDLLARTARLPGTLRLGAVPGGEVILLGDVPEGAALEESEVPEIASEIPTEVVEAVLDEAGSPYRRRQGGWVLNAAEPVRREIEVAVLNGKLRVQAVLTDWETLGEEERRALEWLLCRAQLGLRHARSEMTERQALLAAWLEGWQVERGLADVVGGVAAGVRLLAREADDLLLPSVAATYLRFQEGRAGNTGAMSP